jgi:hypothetical protein
VSLIVLHHVTLSARTRYRGKTYDNAKFTGSAKVDAIATNIPSPAGYNLKCHSSPDSKGVTNGTCRLWITRFRHIRLRATQIPTEFVERAAFRVFLPVDYFDVLFVFDGPFPPEFDPRPEL